MLKNQSNNKDTTFIDLPDTSFSMLMQKRIRKVLVISSQYDFYMLEEDGRIDEHIFNEYVSLNLRYPPVFIHADSAKTASDILKNNDIDLIIEMLSIGDTDAFQLAKKLKKDYSDIPIVVLTHFFFVSGLMKINSPNPKFFNTKSLSSLDKFFEFLSINPTPICFATALFEISDDCNRKGILISSFFTKLQNFSPVRVFVSFISGVTL